MAILVAGCLGIKTVLAASIANPTFTITTTYIPANTSFSFTISAKGALDVDWGDGTVSSASGKGTYSHTYTTAGYYVIGMKGTLTDQGQTTIAFKDNPYIEKMDGSLISLFSGNVSRLNFNASFENCNNLTTISDTLFDGFQGNTEKFANTFSGCSNLQYFETEYGIVNYIPDTMASLNFGTSTFSGTSVSTECPPGTTPMNAMVATCKPNQYTISYVMNGGTNFTGAPTDYWGGTVTEISGTPTYTDYKFVGWCDDAALTQNCAETRTISDMDYGNKTFYAKWILYRSYSITYVMNGGTNYAGAPTDYWGGSTVEISGTPTYADHIFIGWCDDPALTQNCAETRTISDTDSDNKTFYAKWLLYRSYSITYVMNGGTNYAGAPTEYWTGTETIIDGTPINASLRFMGWCDNPELTQNCSTTKIIQEDDVDNKVFYAKWALNTCDSEYALSGDDCAKFTVTTTNMSANTSFSFKISAAGIFIIDWGDGVVESINRASTSSQTYSHTYTTAGVHTIGLSGHATDYSNTTDSSGAAISFNGNKNVAGISGSLGAIFGTLSNGTKQPLFYQTFFNCTNLTGSIPEGVFTGIEGTPTNYMFSFTFNGCTGLTGNIPENLFSGLSGEPAQYMFFSTFDGCTGLTGNIPENLFSGIVGTPKIGMFYSTFKGCSGLTGYIPYKLFSGITGSRATNDFVNTTSGANGLATACPTGISQAIINTTPSFNSLDGHAICSTSCESGTYWNNGECVVCGITSWCADGVRHDCPTGLETIGYGSGADEIGDCGHVLKIGGHVLYSSATKTTSPSLNFMDGNGDMFYLPVSATDHTLSNLHLSDGTNIFTVYDDSLIHGEREF